MSKKTVLNTGNTITSDTPINIRAPIWEICHNLGHDPHQVTQIIFTPDKTTITQPNLNPDGQITHTTITHQTTTT